jgi:hypothetical protein
MEKIPLLERAGISTA